MGAADGAEAEVFGGVRRMEEGFKPEDPGRVFVGNSLDDEDDICSTRDMATEVDAGWALAVASRDGVEETLLRAPLPEAAFERIFKHWGGCAAAAASPFDAPSGTMRFPPI